MKPKHNTKDPLLNQIINHLRLNHGLQLAYLLNKTTTTTQTHNHFPPAINTHQKTFTYTLLIITKTQKQRNVIAPCPPQAGSAAKQPHQPTAHNVMSEPQPVIAPCPPQAGSAAKQPRQSTINSKFNNKVTPQHCGAAQLQDHLHNLTQKQATVHLIPFTLKAVSHQLNNGCNFISKTLTQTPCIFKNETVNLNLTTTCYSPAVYEEIHHEWHTRIQRANYLYDKVSTLNATLEPVACFDILNNVLKQTCLGLIYLFLEYKPSHTGLTHLLHLCTLFTDLPQKLFSKNNYQTHHLLYHLHNANHLLLYKTKHNLTLHHADKAWKKTGRFLKEAKTLALRSLHQQAKEGAQAKSQ